jgi:Rrf2 family protein
MKTDYALRAMFTLVDQHRAGGRPVPIRELARRNDVPKRFLEQIMIELRRKGWVRSLPGRDGGYLLAKPPEKITMGQIVRHIDGLLAPIACVSTEAYRRCSQESVCRFRRVLLEVRNFTARLMDRATLAAVASGLPVTDQEVFDQELTVGAGI